ncbi:Type 1 glutamine amidotransferase-like domain-containing protein [Halomonas organivorans]|uniref:Dipeptidase E n=1 Tax=Halomonas organivorans TaxID=257772 RepID=A0A7W5G4J0_9GAMM|nr:Type 1 glutamine amidotransferase-like domain-containing protein [Halomonas organivorans]MBB3139386.1 dipeptidase E [Halomonas organivorans]
MKSMFLASSFKDVASLFVESVSGECAGKRVTFIPTASLTEEVNFYVAAGKEALENLGMIVDELEISTAADDEIASKLKANDYIYVSGGNSFFLLQELKRKGADRLIAEQVALGKVYIGESAGSIVLTHDIEYVAEMDDVAAAPGMGSFASLGLIDIYPVPHHTNHPFKGAIESIISTYEERLPLCPISNTQAIVVSGDEYSIWSVER